MRTGLKNKFFILFHILSLVLLLGLCSTSYAMSKSEAFEICRDLCGASYLFDTPDVNPGNSSWLSYSNYLNYLDTRTERVMIVYKSNNSAFNSTSATPYINFYDNIDTSSGYQCITTTARRGDIKTVNQSQQYLNFYRPGLGDSQSVGTYNFTPPTGDYRFYMIYYDGNIIDASFNIPPSQVYVPSHDYIVSVNGYNNVNAILRNYSINQWKIGETENFSELDAFMFLLNDLTLGFRVGNVYGYRNLNQINGNGALYFSPNDLYVNSRYISYNHLYQLIVSKTNGDNETLEYYYYIFLPRNAVISNGQIINVGSGDYSVQDSTNAIIANQESGDNKIIGTLTDDSEIDSILENEFTSNSGDIEAYADKFGFTALDNPFTTFLLHILDSTFDALTEPSDVILSADYKTLHFELNSGDFTIPDSPLKDFIRNLLIFLYIYGNYRFFNHLIVLIQTAKIDKAIATLGTDEFYDSDIM